MADIDPDSIPFVPPVEVALTKTDSGRPTTAFHDWLMGLWSWMKNNVVALDHKLTTVESETNGNTAAITTEIEARTDADNALAAQITTVSTTVGENTADISELFTSVNGLGVQWAIQAYVGGSYGGVVFTGLKRADGTGADFLLEIQSNVVINGNLLVTGSVLNVGLNNNAATQIATASGDSSASLAINYRGTGKISIIAYYAGTPAIDRGGVPNLAVSMDSGQIDAVGNNYYAYVPSSGPVAIRLLQTTLLTEITPSPGNHTFTVTNGVGGGVRIWVFEGSK
ncbi:hypothetical protein GCM10019059_37800 [Camelimonas fluminis]|uniref:Uncharacterized protein n=1 Tax=Camelimonas fluminis TaxID=1576911 RepID=A0ABV7UNB1_9HYPH|nr:hypothetical protein [Camelimonas fluminis]GHE74707.1 hypothetical protein GCM10019059_37800 [Camelimonas fluminis]